jgi:hypothetical protein
MAVTLKNKRRRMLVFNLDAPFFVKNRNETGFGQPCTLTMLALERKEGVHDAVLACEEVKAALLKGDLRVLGQTKEPEVETSAVVSTPSAYEDEDED